MFIDRYYQQADGGVSFTREQGSDFAKQVADDFNPLHDVDARRFCIPGDLLFAVMLAHYGVSRHMACVFSGMVTEGVRLLLPEPAGACSIRDADGREYLQLQRRGEVSRDPALIENLARGYVAFSGHSFPDILEPLLAEQGVMINPERPVLIYESMAIDLDTLEFSAPELAGEGHAVAVDGKRGSVQLGFNLLQDGAVVGRGRKHILLSGLRAYDAAAMAAAVADYNARKQAYHR